jgi:hypothetical protein
VNAFLSHYTLKTVLCHLLPVQSTLDNPQMPVYNSSFQAALSKAHDF